MNKLYILLLAALLLGTSMLPGHSSPRRHSQRQQSTGESRAPSGDEQNVNRASRAERLIWNGRSGGMLIRWTSVDLYVRSAAGEERIWAPLVNAGFKSFVAAERETGEEMHTVSCEYDRRFKVLSVVGTLVSFVDRYFDYCGGAHPSMDTRFTSVDLARPGDLAYAITEDTPMMDVDSTRSGKAVKLTDYFPEEEVLKALLADPIVKKALASKHPTTKPTLSQLPDLFSENDYELGDSTFELRPDFLTRFVFHHMEGDRVAVRIGLPPHYGANHAQHCQLGLLLPIPAPLRRAIQLANERKEGFLMKDERRIAGNQVTRFALAIGQNTERRRNW
jgi:hypothetical protein